jgi:methionine aminopeptidase, type I (EC 3.4.11.18)
MITLKSAREIEAMDRAGDFLASIHIGLRDLLKPGVDMWEVKSMCVVVVKKKMFFPFRLVLREVLWITLMRHAVALMTKWHMPFHVTIF